jgi:DNA-binding NarL/FixJ family response regulator
MTVDLIRVQSMNRGEKVQIYARNNGQQQTLTLTTEQASQLVADLLKIGISGVTSEDVTPETSLCNSPFNTRGQSDI